MTSLLTADRRFVTRFGAAVAAVCGILAFLLGRSDAHPEHLFGGDATGCGILVGVGVGLAALAVSGATVGLGGALIISLGLHYGALACAFG
jgi:hypothetical protein